MPVNSICFPLSNKSEFWAGDHRNVLSCLQGNFAISPFTESYSHSVIPPFPHRSAQAVEAELRDENATLPKLAGWIGVRDAARNPHFERRYVAVVDTTIFMSATQITVDDDDIHSASEVFQVWGSGG